MTKISFAFLITALALSPTFGQIPASTMIQILKAEDARRYDKTLENLMKNPDARVRTRATLAIGRIGNEVAIPAIVLLLENDQSVDTRAMAAFALGEIESLKAADAILKVLQDTKSPDAVRARAVEAAGKIAAANAKDEKSKLLGEAILDALEAEDRKGTRQNRDVILFALTAALRAKPEQTDVVTAKFLTNLDPRIRADAANTLSRIKAKNANEALRAMLLSDDDPVARANAARALGAAEDKEAFNLLLEAATEDDDSRVRVSAIRALASLKDVKAADRLIAQGVKLLADYTKARKANLIPTEQNEFIELAVALGRLLANTDNPRADKLFADFGKLDKGHTPEVYIARVRIGPRRGNGSPPALTSWRQYSTLAQVVGEFAVMEPTSETGKQMKSEAPGIIRPLAKAFAVADPKAEAATILAGPDALRAFARFKTDDLGEVLRDALKNKDVFIRAAAAELIAEQPQSKENIDALEVALGNPRRKDDRYNDDQLAILEALGKFDKLYIMRQAYHTLNDPDYLVRRKTAEVLRTKDIDEDPHGQQLDSRVYPLRPYKAGGKSKQGVIINIDADYHRAIARKNGSVKAVFTTEKGIFTIDLLPEDAPLTVDNFIKLAKSNYFNGVEVHRVVPNFVMQDGDPRGDGNGGPGWSIRCEMNMVPYERGAVGMALSGKDTGGSQWFVTHSPQPHLDGGYTVFGRVNETDMKVVDNIVRGDKIISVKIIESGLTQRPQRTPRKSQNRER